MVAEVSGGRFLFVESSSNLEEIFQRILAEMKTRYLLSYIPADVAPDGWHDIEVKVKAQ